MKGLWLGVVGLLLGLGIFLMLRRSIFRVLLGLLCLSHGVNLGILAAAGVIPGQPPLIEGTRLVSHSADALPQALILTAIVIGFGMQALLMFLLYRLHRKLGIEDVAELAESAGENNNVDKSSAH